MYTEYAQSEYTKDAHRELLHKGLGSCQLCCSTITVTQGNFKMIECLQITFQRFSRLLDFSDSRPQLVTQLNFA